jgi:hypothetical protein
MKELSEVDVTDWTTLPKTKGVGLTVASTPAGAVPVEARFAERGLPTASLDTENIAIRAPSVAGVVVMDATQFADGASVPPQVLADSENSVAFKPRTANPEKVTVAELVLVTEIVLAELVVPMV